MSAPEAAGMHVNDVGPHANVDGQRNREAMSRDGQALDPYVG
jgi:hypothetical protein